MTLPNFLIVGAAKAGTTSFFEYLAQHPDVYVPFCKEPHYFSKAPHPAIATTDEEYKKLFFDVKNEKAIGEASVTYLACPDAAYRIKKLLPDVKIIIFLRNPVVRAYSAWWQMYQLGYDNLEFEDALKKEEERKKSTELKQNSPVHYTFYYYFSNGLYSSQVKRYFDLFGRDKVKVYIFEEAVKSVRDTCRELYTFLGIDSSFKPDIKIYNASQVARFRGIQKMLAAPPNFIKKIFDMFPMKVKQAIYVPLKAFYWFNTKKSPRPSMNEDLRIELTNRYLPDIKKLEILLKRDLDFWYK